MGVDTKIEWSDSTVNLMMGCDGCELAAKGGSGTCYAEIMTNRYGGTNKGWPTDFYKPTLFPHRLAMALKWPDLTGQPRADKPWLDGQPRHIFLDDLGDTFTESLPLDWLAPHIPEMAASPHVWMFLTKRPDRMRRFFEGYGSIPSNFMLGTSCIASTARLNDLCSIQGARLYASVEPIWREMDLSPFVEALSLAIFGGESGPKAKPCHIDWIRNGIAQCRKSKAAPFVKQLGSNVITSGCSGPGQHWPRSTGLLDTGLGHFRKHLVHSKGGDPQEWPEDLRVREFPHA